MHARVILHGAILAIANLFVFGWDSWLMPKLLEEQINCSFKCCGIVVSVVVFSSMELVDDRVPNTDSSCEVFAMESRYHVSRSCMGAIMIRAATFVTAGYLPAFSNILAKMGVSIDNQPCGFGIVAGAAKDETPPSI